MEPARPTPHSPNLDQHHQPPADCFLPIPHLHCEVVHAAGHDLRGSHRATSPSVARPFRAVHAPLVSQAWQLVLQLPRIRLLPTRRLSPGRLRRSGGSRGKGGVQLAARATIIYTVFSSRTNNQYVFCSLCWFILRLFAKCSRKGFEPLGLTPTL